VSYGARKSDRVTFARGFDVAIVAIDGTWRRACKLLDVSTTGARLSVEDSIEGLQLAEFFLLLSANGRANRRCELIRVNGDEIGVQFLKSKKPSKNMTNAKRN
jgi:hypothetical protein